MSQFKSTEVLQETWSKVMTPEINENEVAKVRALTKDAVVMQMLENQKEYNEKTLGGVLASLNEDATNSMGSGQVTNWSPILISMVRRSAPNLMVMDFFGTQPLSTPSGQIFAMRVRAGSQTGSELFYKDVSQKLSGETTGTGMTTAEAEKLGGSRAWGKVAVTIEGTSVTAVSRGLFTDYTSEVRQDMMAMYGQDVDAILSDILVTQLVVEQNQEFLHTMNVAAKAGGVISGSALVGSGVYDVVTDSDGRWMAERAQTMLLNIEMNANAIMRDTRMGRGNKIVTSANVVAFMRMASMLSYSFHNQNANKDLIIEPNESYAGKLCNGMDVYIDQYAMTDYITVAYKGSNPLDAGIYYAPYTPIEMSRAIDPNTFQPRIGIKSRYGICSNPYFSKNANGTDFTGKGLGAGENGYFRTWNITSVGL